MGRKRLFEKPLTAAQRQQRRRDKHKSAFEAQCLELQLRQDFYAWLNNYLFDHPAMAADVSLVKNGISAVLQAVWVANYIRHNPDKYSFDDYQEFLNDALYEPEFIKLWDGHDGKPYIHPWFADREDRAMENRP